MIGLQHEASHRIITNDAVPVRLHAYRCPNAYEQKFRKELHDYKLIEPSTSPWAAPMFAVPKRGSEDLRLLVNDKRLNEVTQSDPYQMPRMEVLREKWPKQNSFQQLT